MEILSNIWLALTTENEMLVKIFTIILTPLEHFLILTLFLNILRIKTNTRNKFIYVFTFSLISIINIFFIPAPFNIFTNYIFAFIIIFFLFKIGILKTVFAVFSPAIIFILLETLLLPIFTGFLNISTKQAQLIPIYRLFFNLITYFSLVFLLFLLKFKKFKLKFLEHINRKTKLIIMFDFIFRYFNNLCTNLY